MPVTPPALVDLILLGPTWDRRQLQDSPILGDVWLAYASEPGKKQDLLITPDRNHPAGQVAKTIASWIGIDHTDDKHRADIAYLHGLIGAKLSFRDLLRFIVPMTVWWQTPKVQKALESLDTLPRLEELLKDVIAWAKAFDDVIEREKCMEKFATYSGLHRYFALAGIVLWAEAQITQHKTVAATMKKLGTAAALKSITSGLEQLLEEITTFSYAKSDTEFKLVYEISLNRRVLPALERSVPAVKGDAARMLFRVNCASIGWAILDSGIDGSHPALQDDQGQPRVVSSFDFGNIRKIISLDNQNEETLNQRAIELCAGRTTPTVEEAKTALRLLADDADNDRPVDWGRVTQFITIPRDQKPNGGHGTHVAGIIGGRATGNVDEPGGMCPDIKLYDFRVLANTLEDTEFAIISALQYLRYLNSRQNFMVIHGANLSLSIAHDVRNFACGRTPICEECERVVDSGVVVVAAAGNRGYQSFQTKDGIYDGYAAFSITDPGNADCVITVGSTHRFWPHTYGISFFSSRGPTGDGRLKPDIVAPGERIRSCLPDNDWGDLDGTSMAAPHVCGAAAMLMARYTEFIGRPRKLKSILCETATDLGRERSFQGHGMVDVLRAFQKI